LGWVPSWPCSARSRREDGGEGKEAADLWVQRISERETGADSSYTEKEWGKREGAGVASAGLVARVLGHGLGRVEKGQGQAERGGEEWAFGPESGGRVSILFFSFLLFVGFFLYSRSFQNSLKSI